MATTVTVGALGWAGVKRMTRVTTEQQRTGHGEIVPRAYEMQRGQEAFFWALGRTVPEAIEALHGQQFKAAFAGVAFVEGNRRVISPEGESLLRDWQNEWRLVDEWSRDAALRIVLNIRQIAEVQVCVNNGPWEQLPVSYAGLYVGREVEEIPAKSLELLESLEWEADVAEAALHTMPVEINISLQTWFDPRTQTVDQVTKRIMPVIEERVRSNLQRTKEQDKAMGNNVPVTKLPSRQHFEWTVRYQVLGEPFAQIANADEVERVTVSRNVRGVADLIGLTLRPPDTGDPRTGGRPKKQKTRTAVRRTTKW